MLHGVSEQRRESVGTLVRARPVIRQLVLPAPVGVARWLSRAEAWARGEIVMLIDHAARNGRGRGALAASADSIDADRINRMLHACGGGLVGIVVDLESAFRLGLRMMGAHRAPESGVLYLASIESADCTGTGISAADRAHTIQVVAAPGAGADDVQMPGHIIPMLVDTRAQSRPSCHGVALELAREHGGDIAAFCDVLDQAGELASADDCVRIAAREGFATAGFQGPA